MQRSSLSAIACSFRIPKEWVSPKTIKHALSQQSKLELLVGNRNPLLSTRRRITFRKGIHAERNPYHAHAVITSEHHQSEKRCEFRDCWLQSKDRVERPVASSEGCAFRCGSESLTLRSQDRPNSRSAYSDWTKRGGCVHVRTLQVKLRSESQRISSGKQLWGPAIAENQCIASAFAVIRHKLTTSWF